MSSAALGDVPLRPLAARSLVLSLLLGMHPPQLPVRDLVRAVEAFEVAEATLRVALTRMVAAGDLHRMDGTYRLSDRLIARQRRQDESVHPRTRGWRGRWEIAMVTAAGRTAAQRSELRKQLVELRLAELREGVWLRPANLRRRWPDGPAALVSRFTGRPDGDALVLAQQLWDLDGWAATGRAVLHQLRSAGRPAARFTAAAAGVRHLLADPVLPAELLPANWPGAELRQVYAAYRAELVDDAKIAGRPA